MRVPFYMADSCNNNVQYLSVITNRSNEDKNSNINESGRPDNSDNNNSNNASSSKYNNNNSVSDGANCVSNSNCNSDNKTEVDSADTDEEDMVDKAPQKAIVKSNRVQVPSEYYKISMSELRYYENLLRIFVLASLKRIGVCVVENFLPDSFANGVECEIRQLYNDKTNVFKPPVHDYRGDHIHWLGSNAEKERELKSIKKLEVYFHQLIVSMVSHEKQRGNLLKITHKSRTQVSCFKAGEIGYKPHIDNPNNNGRLLSITYYSNKNYTRIEDGGLVRFYLDNNTKFIELEPKFNTAVIHWSNRRVIKEVLPSTTHKNLFHLSSWFFGSCADTGSKRRLAMP